MTDKPAHYCPDWDFLLVEPDDPEMDACLCTFPEDEEPSWMFDPRCAY